MMKNTAVSNMVASAIPEARNPSAAVISESGGGRGKPNRTLERIVPTATRAEKAPILAIVRDGVSTLSLLGVEEFSPRWESFAELLSFSGAFIVVTSLVSEVRETQQRRTASTPPFAGVIRIRF